MLTPNAVIFKLNTPTPVFQMYSFKGDTLIDGITFTTLDKDDSYNDLNDNQIAYIVVSFDKQTSRLLCTISLFGLDNVTPTPVYDVPFEELQRMVIHIMDDEEFGKGWEE